VKREINATAIINHPVLPFKAYEFHLPGTGVYIPESGILANEFRIEVDKKTLDVTIYVLSFESWETHENCTDIFHVGSILQECIRQERKGNVPNLTVDYLNYLKKKNELIAI
jgi:hypothetical protein